jgi:hypothetical protein
MRTTSTGIHLAQYGQVGRNYFVRNESEEDWVLVSDLPKDMRQALEERGERERLARKDIIDSLFDALRQEPWVAAAVMAIAKAKETNGKRIVDDALQDYQYPCGAIGGHMIERGYLTMEHVAELLRGEPKGRPDIFGPDSD